MCGDVAFRYDRDPIHTAMPEHKHLGDRRIPWSRVTFQEVVDEVLDLLDQLEQEDEQDRTASSD